MKLSKLTACAALAVMAARAPIPVAHAQGDLDAYKARCAAYGFAPGSAELAQCVQKLDMQQPQQPRFDCATIAQQQRYYCSGGGSDTIGSGSSAAQCGVYTDAFNAHCQ